MLLFLSLRLRQLNGHHASPPPPSSPSPPPTPGARCGQPLEPPLGLNERPASPEGRALRWRLGSARGCWEANRGPGAARGRTRPASAQQPGVVAHSGLACSPGGTLRFCWDGASSRSVRASPGRFHTCHLLAWGPGSCPHSDRLSAAGTPALGSGHGPPALSQAARCGSWRGAGGGGQDLEPVSYFLPKGSTSCSFSKAGVSVSVSGTASARLFPGQALSVLPKDNGVKSQSFLPWTSLLCVNLLLTPRC